MDTYTQQAKFDVFISYSHKDYVDEHKNIIPGNDVSRIKEALAKAGITYWFDEEGIYSGNNFVEKIVTNIEASEIFVFLSTANANNSTYTCKEIACADEEKKPIIPVRIDDTPYNKKVLFRIADLNYIEYYTNPEKGINDLIEAIKTHLATIKERERRKEEEQKKLISDIKLKNATLNNEEAKIELDRKNLLLQAEGVSEKELRDRLKTEISSGGPIHQKYQQVCSSLTDEISNYKETINHLNEVVKLSQDKLEEKESRIAILEDELKPSKTKNIINRNGLFKSFRKNKWTLSVLIPLLVTLAFLVCLFLFHNTYEYSKYWIDESPLIVSAVCIYIVVLFLYYWYLHKHKKKEKANHQQ